MSALSSLGRSKGSGGGTALAAGVVGSLVAGLVKIGWDAVLPPGTPERNDPNPPMHLLEQIGVPETVRNATVTFNGNEVGVAGLSVHHAFSVGTAVPYCLLAERCPAITAGGGALYGLGIWAGFHLAVLPAVGTVPSATEQPWQEHLSEALGHVIWAGTIEAVRRDLTV